jgi:hypothetical protein
LNGLIEESEVGDGTGNLDLRARKTEERTTQERQQTLEGRREENQAHLEELRLGDASVTALTIPVPSSLPVEGVPVPVEGYVRP